MADYMGYLSHVWSGARTLPLKFVNLFRRNPQKRGVTHEELENAFSDFLTKVTETIKKGDLDVSGLSKERIKILQQEVTRQISKSQDYICRVVAAHDAQLDEQNKNDRNSLRKEARDLREEFKALREARIPELHPYVLEVVGSILGKLVPSEVEKSAPAAVKKAVEDLLQEKRPQLEKSLEQNLVSIINKLEGVEGANIEQLVEKKKEEREKAVHWRRIKIWGLTAATIGILGYVGYRVYGSVTQKAEDAIIDAGTAVIAVNKIKKEMTIYKSEVEKKLESYKQADTEQIAGFTRQINDEKAERAKLEQRVNAESEARVKGLEAQMAGLNTGVTKAANDIKSLSEIYDSGMKERQKDREYAQALETSMQALNKRIGELVAKQEEYVKGTLTREEFDKQITGIAAGLESLKKEIAGYAELMQKYEDLSERQRLAPRQANENTDLPELPELELKLGY